MTNSVVFPAPRARARHRTFRHDLSIIVAWLISLISIAIWVHGGALAAFRRGPGDALAALGGLAGWFAALIFLFQILLMARVPFFEFGFGRDHIVAWHRKLGFWSFWILLAHILFMVIGYGVRFGNNVFVQFWSMITTWRGVWLAAIGTLLIFIPVIGLSVKRFRSKMRYEAWHLWHLLAYPAVFLALPHMIWSGSSFITTPLARRFWTILWVAVALCTLLFRFIMPLIRSNRHDLRVAEVIQDGNRGITVKMKGKNLDQLGARGGSFFTWRFMDGAGSLAGHPLSLSMPPTNDSLQIAVRTVGDGTNRMATLRPGTKVLFEGPMGRVNGDLRLGHRLLMFGAGAGIGPMMAILGEQSWQPGEAILITRDNTPEETMMIPEIEELVRSRGLIWHREVGGLAKGGSMWLPPGPDGIAPDGVALIQSWLADDPHYPGHHAANEYANTDVFVCGPPPWMKAVKQDLAAAGMAPEQIHIEEFAY